MNNMNSMNNIITEMVKIENAEIKKHIEESFKKHFGFSIQDVELKEIKHIMNDFDPIESFMYRGETFLYMKRHDENIDIKFDEQSGNYNVTFNMVFDYV